MSTKDAKSVKQNTGADLRALAEARLSAQRGPAVEAQRREASFLKNLSGARDDYQWIMSNEAWTQLGYADYTTWYVARVYPLLKALGARPSLEIANDVLDRVPADEAALPAPQRRTQEEIAELAGVSKKTVARRSQDLSGGTLSPGGDLGEVADPTAVFDAKYSTNSQPAATDAGGDGLARPGGAPADQPSESNVPEGGPTVAAPGQPGHEPSEAADEDTRPSSAVPQPGAGVLTGGGAPEEGVRAPSSGTPPPDPDALRGRPDLDPAAVERYADATTAAEVSAWRRDFTKALNTARKALRPYTAQGIVDHADEEGDGEFVDFRDFVTELFDEWQQLKTDQRLAKVRPLRSVS